MAKFQKLEEEIKIDINDSINQTKIILRSLNNENTNYYIDNEKIQFTKQFRHDIMDKLNISEDKILKLFFKGKILLDDNKISDYKLTTDDVVLYMIGDLPKEDNNVSILTQNVENSENSNTYRGFNVFRQYGLEPVEIQLMRIIFHANSITIRGAENLEWSPQAIITREEEWLNNNRNDDMRNNINIFNNRAFPFSRNLLLNRNRLRQDIINREEPNLMFFLGFFIGIVLNIYTIFFLVFCNFRTKFKLGLKLGMIVGTIIFILYNFITYN